MMYRIKKGKRRSGLTVFLSILLSLCLMVTLTPMTAFADEISDLSASIAAAKTKLATPPVATGKNDPNAWMTNPINIAAYQTGGCSTAELNAMTAAATRPYSVGEVQVAIDTAQALIDSSSTDTAALTAAKAALDRATANLKGVRVYDSFSGIDAYATGGDTPNTAGQSWFDTNGYRIQSHGGQVIHLKPETLASSYAKAGKTNPYPEDEWFWTGEDRSGGNAAFSLYSSKDLYNWNFRGDLLRKPIPLEPGVADGRAISVYERPKLMYNAKNDNFVLWFHADSRTNADSSGYAAGMAGYAVGATIDSLYTYGTRSRRHQLADADYVNWNTYPFTYPNYSGAPYNAGPYWYEKPIMRGMARDMTVFVDDDNTGYLIYSSEENRTMYISRLNEDYTDLDKPNGVAVEGTDFVRLFPGGQREAPALFKYNGKYYLISSGATGWHPNGSTIWASDSIFGRWDDLGDCVVPAGEDLSTYPTLGYRSGRLTFGTQSTNVIPVDPASGKYIYMGDRWGASGSTNSGHVWLPITFKPAGGIEINGLQYWTLHDFPTGNALRVKSSLPEYYFDTADLPETLNVETVTGGSWSTHNNVAVTWDADANDEVISGLNNFEKGQLVGTVTINGSTYQVKVPYIKVSKDTRYLVDAGALGVGGSNLFANAANFTKIKAAAPKLKNTVADQVFTDATEANNFGLTSTIIGTAYNSTALYYGPTTSKQYDFSGYYINYQGTPRSTIAYKMYITDNGPYTLSIGTHDYWGPVRRTFNLRATYTDADGATVVKTSPLLTSVTTNSFSFTFPVINLPAGGTYLTVELVEASGSPNTGPEGNKQENGPNMTWLALAVNSSLSDCIADTRAFMASRNQADYISSTWNALEAAVTAAENLLSTDYSQTAADAAITDVADALSKLKLKASSGLIDAFKFVVENFEATFPKADYTPSSYAPFGEALAAAKAIIAAPVAYSDEDVYVIWDALLDASGKLVRIADKSGLKMAIDYAENILKPANVGKYIPASVANLEDVLSGAAIVYGDADATQAKVDKANEDLLKAIGQVYEKGDKAGLQALVTLVSRYAPANYTPASWTAFTKALEDARAVIANPNAVKESVDKAYTALTAAITGLTRKADVAALNSSITLAQQIVDNIGDYVPSTVVGLAEELAAAKVAVNNPDATQAQVNAATAALNAKILAARLKPDLSGLLSATARARALEESLYTAESYKVLTTAVAGAEAILSAPEKVTQADVDDATVAVYGAIATLVAKPPVATAAGNDGKNVAKTVIPKGKISKIIASAKGKIVVKWAKAPAAAKVTGYQVQYRVKGASKWTTKTVSAKSASLTIKNLKKNKKYQIRVRAYRTDFGTEDYGAWSAVKVNKK